MNNEDRVINITSNYQSGGITAHTVNVGTPARQMNSEIANQLRQNIPTTASVTISAVLGDAEAFNYATQICNWMKSNGYYKVDGVNQSIYTQPVLGQNAIKTSDSSFEIHIGTKQ